MKKTKKRAVALMIALLLFLSIFTVLGTTLGTTANAGGYEGWHQFDGKWYYYLRDVAQTGWLKDNGVWYYLDPENGGAMYNEGFAYIDGQSYYMTASGRTVQNGWHKISEGFYKNAWIKAYPSGVLITGWVKEGSDWYYLDPLMIQWVFREIDNVYYYFKQNGVLYTKEGWFQGTTYDGFTYWLYANQGGSLKTGWFQYYNKWFYLDPGMSRGIIFVRNEDNFYYLDENGVCSTQAGWLQADNGYGDMRWYYRQKGGPLKMGWFKDRGKWYYLIPSMVANGTYELDGKNYTFDKNGVWIP